MEEKRNDQTGMSRRKLLKVGVGAAAVLGVSAAAANAQIAHKASQKDAGYQDSPNGAQSCSNCRNFQAPSSCRVIEGTVSPTGYCRMYAKKA
jgi:hypothetical protein